MELWEIKAHKLIASYSYSAWLVNGKKPGYSVPELARALVKALGIHNNKEREHEIKRLFQVEYYKAYTLI